MARKKALLILPQLKDCGGDLKKKWFVEYSCRNPRTDEMKRFRVYDGFADLQTAKERYALAEKIISDIKLKLENGEMPFKEKPITYQDELIYKTAALRWGKERESIVSTRVHLSEFLARKRSEVIPHSFQTYQSKLRIFNEWLEQTGLEKKHISFICQENISDFIRFMVESNNISRRTVKKYEQILHGFFDYLIKVKKVITCNPVHDLPKIGIVKDEAPRPIPDKERTILTAYMKEKDPQLWLLCQMEYYCAIRPNECRQLKIGDIDFDNGTIKVPKDISKNRLTETVNIPRQLYSYLVDRLVFNELPREYYVFSQGGQPGTKMLGKNNFRFRFDRIRNRLGLPAEYKLYSFKHTGGVKLVNAGVDAWELQRHFRHKSIDTTEKYIRRNFGIKSDKIQNEFPDM